MLTIHESCASRIAKGTDFYRVRAADAYKLYDSKDLFVIPDDKQSKVGQYRFNRPGKSCLYLASNLYLAWEECRRPDFSTVNFSRFRNVSELKVLDLTIKVEPKEIGHFIMAFLTLLCSVNDEDKYKFQYDVPGMMMDLLIYSQANSKGINNAYAGIRYLSSRRYECRDFLFDDRSLSEAYVFPQRPHTEKDGCCQFLKSRFKMTDPRSYFLYKVHRYNFDVTHARFSDYRHSLFGQLEVQLKNEKVKFVGK